MKVDFSRKILSIDEEEIPLSRITGVESNKDGLTLKDITVFALCSLIRGDDAIDALTAFKRLELARRINKGGEQELEPDEATLLRDRAAKILPIQLSGAAYEMLKG